MLCRRSRSFILLENSLFERAVLSLFCSRWMLLLGRTLSIFFSSPVLSRSGSQSFVSWAWLARAHNTGFVLVVNVVAVFICPISVFADYNRIKRANAYTIVNSKSSTKEKRTNNFPTNKTTYHIFFIRCWVHMSSWWVRLGAQRMNLVTVSSTIHWDRVLLVWHFSVVFEWVHNILHNIFWRWRQYTTNQADGKSI